MSRKFLFALIGVFALMLSLVAVASLQAQTFTVNISSTGCSIDVTITASIADQYTINVQTSSPYNVNSWYTNPSPSMTISYSIPLYSNFVGSIPFTTVNIWNVNATSLLHQETIANVNVNCTTAPSQPSTNISNFPPSSCSGASATISGDPGSYDLYLFAFDSG
jgi:Tfp pilus assembly protein PilV